MNKKIVVIIVIIVLIAVWFSRKADAPDIMDTGNTQAVPEEVGLQALPEEVGSGVSEVVVSGEVKEFVVVGSPFKFSMNEIRVAEGDKVRIVFKNEKGTHDWKIDEFNAATKVIQTGEEDIVEFVADKAGTFEYYCSVGDHRAKGMFGKLVVE